MALEAPRLSRVETGLPYLESWKISEFSVYFLCRSLGIKCKSDSIISYYMPFLLYFGHLLPYWVSFSSQLREALGLNVTLMI